MLGKLFSKPQVLHQQDPLLSLLKGIFTYMVVHICLILASEQGLVYSNKLFKKSQKRRHKKLLRFVSKSQKTSFSALTLTNYGNLNFSCHKNVTGMKSRISSLVQKFARHFISISDIGDEIAIFLKSFFQFMVMAMVSWNSLGFRQISHSGNNF